MEYNITYYGTDEIEFKVVADCIGAALDKGAKLFKKSVRPMLRNVTITGQLEDPSTPALLALRNTKTLRS